jgi:ubiquinone/menaquinone biosynthesis C-methylase UbiE
MELTSWALDRPVNSPFARPNGLVGRLAGRFMLFTNKQTEVADLLDPRPDSRILEVGFGPGGLIRLLRRRIPDGTVRGVDPSADMVAVARRVNRGGVELRVGTAERTGYPDESFDVVVSVNNVALWPSLEAGLRELHRVVRPGGTVLIAWHGGRDPSRIARRLTLPADKLERIRGGLAELFGEVERRELTSLTVFRARR